jgi:hypothetical protein
MNYTVTWRPAALNRLAAIWTAAADRQVVADAADAMDAELAHDPQTKGEARLGATRILIQAPLAIYFDVSEPDRLVSVWAVWTC